MSRFVEEIPESYLELQRADFFARRRQYLDKPGLPGGGMNHHEQDDFNQVNKEDG